MLVIVVLGGFVVAVSAFALSALRSRLRLARAGGFECAVRASSDRTGRGARWRHVQAVATQGRLDIRVIGPGGLWLPPRRSSALEVLDARLEPGRRTGWRSAWSIDPTFHIVTLETPEGGIETAVAGREVERLLALLHGAPGDGPPRVA